LPRELGRQLTDVDDPNGAIPSGLRNLLDKLFNRPQRSGARLVNAREFDVNYGGTTQICCVKSPRNAAKRPPMAPQWRLNMRRKIYNSKR
jgi:hypothetical protein